MSFNSDVSESEMDNVAEHVEVSTSSNVEENIDNVDSDMEEIDGCFLRMAAIPIITLITHFVGKAPLTDWTNSSRLNQLFAVICKTIDNPLKQIVHQFLKTYSRKGWAFEYRQFRSLLTSELSKYSTKYSSQEARNFVEELQTLFSDSASSCGSSPHTTQTKRKAICMSSMHVDGASHSEGADVQDSVFSKKSGDLALELENAVANNIPCEIFTLAHEGGNVNGLTQSGESLVHLAVRNGSTSSIAALGFLKADLDVFNTTGATPMEEAIKMDNVPVIKELILAGAKIEKKLLKGNSYLHIAVFSGKNEALRTLLEAGLVPDLRNHLGDTSLQLAVKVGNVEGVEILQERCVNSFLISKVEKRLLQKSVVSSNVDMFSALIKCRTLQDFRFESDDTLFHLIVRSKKATEMLKVLKGRRLQLNIRNKNSLAPIHIATDPSVVETLLEMGANVNITTGKGETALHIASAKGYLIVVKVLVKHGAGVDLQDNHNETALMAATKSKANILVMFLLYSGADQTLRNKDGYILPLKEAAKTVQ